MGKTDMGGYGEMKLTQGGLASSTLDIALRYVFPLCTVCHKEIEKLYLFHVNLHREVGPDTEWLMRKSQVINL